MPPDPRANRATIRRADSFLEILSLHGLSPGHLVSGYRRAADPWAPGRGSQASLVTVSFRPTCAGSVTPRLGVIGLRVAADGARLAAGLGDPGLTVAFLAGFPPISRQQCRSCSISGVAPVWLAAKLSGSFARGLRLEQSCT